ncbi:hypothetical protein FisN_29Lh104 [Fistulifera solaris]|uniref:Uncharacterized protein n=1 Tax=Fistulifera solaris TaxID=1519565 RepID=A0A1Z5JM77_FISSO|nr:hypothetical protein FisN_29Lh104 [Fistulifera solaris]|eukprot:GAX14888.1 hypothetical protein FisN_29Lh104 [Fistulifera solaris]
MPMYRFRRDPSHLNEIDWEKYHNTFLWRDNKTIIHMSESGEFFIVPQKRVSFYILRQDKEMLRCAVYGKTDAAIAETISFLWSLRAEVGGQHRQVNSLLIDFVVDFDVTVLTAEQLAQILDSNPTREYYLAGGVWSTQQAVIMATRPYLLDLKLGGEPFAFEDDGAAFVDALEKRQMPFGSLWITLNRNERGFSRATMERLLKLKLEILESINVTSRYEGRFLEPLTAKVKALEYIIDGRYYRPEDFESIEISAKDLNLTWYLDETGNYNGLLIFFLNRVAELGYLERLNLSTSRSQRALDNEFPDMSEFPAITKALVDAIAGNQKLTHLNLQDTYFMCYYPPHLNFQDIFRVIENHGSLRSFTISRYPRADPNYSWLKQLLSRNRYITVFDSCGTRCSDGSSVDQIYALNYFFCGSAELMKVSPSLRPTLLATALMESASEKYQYAALLLSDHTDVLCECLQEY